ncbi:polysaccharide biosynthesis/export family protein [Mesorhizobium mediterraneum]|uniref:polysaccharide biosynthesis/export family protein n=1 Tax=Mesorhizobium mediterraneum TaxID=43617 RepID=UPI001786DC04|nr:polysaccharide biosynthesis/export family protein [Mesorhizobium mediterraneum]
MAAPTTQAEERYEFASGDVLRLVLFGRPELSGSFRVGPDDSISLPLVGTVSVAGKDRAELEDSLRAVFTKAISTEANVTLDIDAYRPFFVLGTVNKPGSYQYQPGVTVLQAVAIAGGIYSLAQNEASNLLVLSHREQERLDTATGQLKLLLARRARLVAEHTGQHQIAVPIQLKLMAGDQEASKLVADESDLMRARAQSLANQIESQDQVRVLAEKHIVDLKGQLAAVERQLDLTDQELQMALGLKEKGLTTGSHVFDLQRALADFAAQKLDVQSSIDRAEQDAVRYANSSVQAPLDHALQVAEDLKSNERDVGLQMAALVGAADIVRTITGVASTIGSAANLSPTYTIVRKVGSEFQHLDVHEIDRILPGDVLKVKKDGPGVAAGAMSGAGPTN